MIPVVSSVGWGSLVLVFLLARGGAATPRGVLRHAGHTQDVHQTDWQTEKSFRPDLQRRVTTRSDRWEVSLTDWGKCAKALSGWCYSFRVEDELDSKVSRFRLANQTAQVDALSIVGQTRLAILGEASPTQSIVTDVTLPSGAESDRIVCTEPSLSPNRRYLAYVKFVPSHPGYDWSPSAEYLVYDLAASPEYNRTPPSRARPREPYDVGWPLYPEGIKNVPGDDMLEGHDVPAHWMISHFSWIDESDTVAFVDRYKGGVSLILADLTRGIQQPKVVAYPVDIVTAVDLPGCKDKVAPSDFEGWSRDPAVLINVKDIETLRDNKSILRLHLSPHPCLRSDVLDVPLDSLPAD